MSQRSHSPEEWRDIMLGSEGQGDENVERNQRVVPETTARRSIRRLRNVGLTVAGVAVTGTVVSIAGPPIVHAVSSAVGEIIQQAPDAIARAAYSLPITGLRWQLYGLWNTALFLTGQPDKISFFEGVVPIAAEGIILFKTGLAGRVIRGLRSSGGDKGSK